MLPISEIYPILKDGQREWMAKVGVRVKNLLKKSCYSETLTSQKNRFNLDVLSVVITGHNALYFSIRPIDTLLEEIQGKSVRPFNRITLHDYLNRITES